MSNPTSDFEDEDINHWKTLKLKKYEEFSKDCYHSQTPPWNSTIQKA